jgi:Holliday junction DNA helicase RuvA
VIGSLRGSVLERHASGEALVEVNGVGYLVQVTPRTLAELEPGSPAFLHVHHHIREDAQTLYGFLSRDERETFQVLIGTHGVGPALALAILGVHAPSVLRDIVSSADLSALCLVPGVGRKTAERLLVELKNRLDVVGVDVLVATGAASAATPLHDVREALTGLGYTPEEVREALRDLRPDGADAPTLLRDALAVLGARRA